MAKTKEWMYFEKTEAYHRYENLANNLLLTAHFYAEGLMYNILSVCNASLWLSELVRREHECFHSPPGWNTEFDSTLMEGCFAIGVNFERLFQSYVTLRFISTAFLEEDEEMMMMRLMSHIRRSAQDVLDEKEGILLKADEAFFDRAERILRRVDELSEGVLPALRGVPQMPKHRWDVIEAVCEEINCPYAVAVEEAMRLQEHTDEAVIPFHTRPSGPRIHRRGNKGFLKKV